MNIELVIFDLDGTLVSSHKTIYLSTRYALNKLNIKGELPEEKFYTRIGLHFEDIFDEFGIQVNDFEEFITIYKSIYFDFMESSLLYDHVLSTIKQIKNRGKKVALLTTKGQDQAEKIVAHFNLNSQFDYVMGRRSGLAHKPSPEPLLKICEDLDVRPGNSMIIGDTEMDIQCGKNAGAYTCGVTYGYRSEEELTQHKPDFLIDKIYELVNILN